MHAFAVTALSVLTAVEEKAPDDEDVVAGWMGFAVFMFLILAVVVIGWALTRSLRTAKRAKEEGAFGDVPAAEEDTTVD
ncbi:MAG: hypothetical protein NTX33_19590 [Propionibacteriales bacterium]|nr:hypothetical protein [Propionibacteriales bacterium]